ncbi:MAG: acetyltransferase [Pseudomonadota bacterium]
MTNPSRIDVAGNRRARKYSFGVLAARVLWRLCHPLFSLSPRPLWVWRRVLLRAFGARIGSGAHIYPSVRITMPWNISIGADAAIGDRATLYALGTIAIGDRATVSQGAHLCAGTHDIADPARKLLTPPIVVETEAWICADAFVGPDVIIGQGAILGARAVAMKNVEAGVVAVGNPARTLKPAPAFESDDGKAEGTQ